MENYDLNQSVVMNDYLESCLLRLTELARKAKFLSESIRVKIKNTEKLLTLYITEYVRSSVDLQKKFGDLIVELEVFFSEKRDVSEIKHADEVFGKKLIEIIIFSKSIKLEKNKSLCVAKGCENFAINSHTISRANNFRNGINYYNLRTRGDNKKNGGLYLARVLSTQASTRPIFCSYHDSHLFSDIEGLNNVDVNKPEHLYLQNWRIFLANQYDEENYIERTRLSLFDVPGQIISKPLTTPDILKKVDKSYFDEEVKDIAYIVIKFNAKPPILASFSLNVSNIIKHNVGVNQNLYFHLLQNNSHHCLIISGFRTRHVLKTLNYLKKIYEKDSFEFWQKLFHIIPLKKNVFFTEEIALNESLSNKIKQIELLKQSDVIDFKSDLSVSFSKKEVFNFFGVSSIKDNLEIDCLEYS